MKTKNKTVTGSKLIPRVALTGAALMLLLVLHPPGLSLPPVAWADEVHGEPIGAPPAATALTNTTPASVSGDKITNAAPAVAPAASIPASLAAVKSVGAPPKIDGCLSVSFDQLASFDFAAPDTQVTNHVKPDVADKFIPAEVKALDGKKVVVRGFMLPLRVADGDRVTEFLIMRSQSTCCFGVTPKITEFVNAKVTGKGLTASMDQPLNFEGTLHVGATRDNGYIIDIYTFEAEKLVADATN